MKEILMIIGMITVGGIIFLAFYMACESIKEKINEWKWECKYKHRFDKSPTAKCYCKDCFYYKPYSNSRDSGRCGRGHIENWTVCDNHFCWQSTPYKKEPKNN